MAVLKTVAARIARTIRCIAIAFTTVQVIIWHSFYSADPWRLTGPVIAIAWAAAVVAYLRRRWPPWQLACLDSAILVVLGLTVMWSVPPIMRGDSANWLYIMMAVQLFVPAWFAPTAVSLPLVLTSAAAYWVGAARIPAPGAGDTSHAAAAALLLAVAAANLSGRHILYRRAREADAALADADRDVREQYVVLSRNIERREHERLLHDTVLNTLTALTRAGSSDAVVGRCRHDVTLMEYALNDSGDPAKEAGGPYGGLLIGIQAVAIEMRARGLDVHLEVGGGIDAGDATAGDATAGDATAGDAGAPQLPQDAPEVPVPVAAALTHAVREALANVVSHAGTREAWVEVHLAESGSRPAAAAGLQVPAGAAGLQVTVRDAGVGFDPGRVDPARLGLRRSIIERIADQGAEASVRSAPGEGTEVTLRWTAAAHPSQAANAGSNEPVEPAAVTRDRLLQEGAESEVPRVVGTVAVIWQVTLLVQVLIYLRDYHHPVVPLAVWLGMCAAAVLLVPRARRGGLTRRESAASVAVAIAVVVLIGWDRRVHGTSGTVDWSVAGTAWLLALVALSRPAWEWISGALLIFVAHAVFFIRLLGVSPLGLARLAVTAYTLMVILYVFTALRPTLRTHAAMAARRAALTSRSVAERAAAAAVREDRRRRFALLEIEALPLLRGIAEGTVDPGDGEVRERCGRHATTLRRALVDRAQEAGGLLADLEPALRAAKARGLPVEVQVLGDPGCPEREVAGATLAAVDRVMSALPPQPVTLTILASADDVELYVIFDRAPRSAPDVTGLRREVPVTARWHATVDVDDTGAGCLEVRWWKAVPA